VGTGLYDLSRSLGRGCRSGWSRRVRQVGLRRHLSTLSGFRNGRGHRPV